MSRSAAPLSPGLTRGDLVLVTGGAGFIGTNLADALAARGFRVLVYDNLARDGVRANLDWLRARHGDLIESRIGDVRDAKGLAQAVSRAACVFHLAAQVAVTTSLDRPREDFEINALGTFNVLEAMTLLPDPPPLVFTSTNKVYGKLGGLALRETDSRWEPADPGLAGRGMGEDLPLDFHSPYGCSKGAADQYVIDFARIYGLPAVVLRMSCIYGPHQYGTEDQGWVAHFLLSALRHQPITVYGDGKQVRDILHVEDLVRAMLLAVQHMDVLRGQAFNMGGGPGNAISLIELLQHMKRLGVWPSSVGSAECRNGDQAYFVADTGKFGALTGWRPSVHKEAGIANLCTWLARNRF